MVHASCLLRGNEFSSVEWHSYINTARSHTIYTQLMKALDHWSCNLHRGTEVGTQSWYNYTSRASSKVARNETLKPLIHNDRGAHHDGRIECALVFNGTYSQRENTSQNADSNGKWRGNRSKANADRYSEPQASWIFTKWWVPPRVKAFYGYCY